MNKLQTITCPTCGKKNTWSSENSFKPFCSERCRLIDLGEWARETRKIPGAPADTNLPTADDKDANDPGDHFF